MPQKTGFVHKTELISCTTTKKSLQYEGVDLNVNKIFNDIRNEEFKLTATKDAAVGIYSNSLKQVLAWQYDYVSLSKGPKYYNGLLYSGAYIFGEEISDTEEYTPSEYINDQIIVLTKTEIGHNKRAEILGRLLLENIINITQTAMIQRIINSLFSEKDLTGSMMGLYLVIAEALRETHPLKFVETYQKAFRLMYTEALYLQPKSKLKAEKKEGKSGVLFI